MVFPKYVYGRAYGYKRTYEPSQPAKQEETTPMNSARDETSSPTTVSPLHPVYDVVFWNYSGDDESKPSSDAAGTATRTVCAIV
jgi:hypothetical protein